MPAPSPSSAAACERLGGACQKPGKTTLPFDDAVEVDRTLRAILAEVLGIDRARVDAFDDGSELFGAMPEFDSMAVAALLTALEERLGILIEDHEVDADMLETYGNLRRFAETKALA